MTHAMRPSGDQNYTCDYSKRHDPKNKMEYKNYSPIIDLQDLRKETKAFII